MMKDNTTFALTILTIISLLAFAGIYIEYAMNRYSNWLDHLLYVMVVSSGIGLIMFFRSLLMLTIGKKSNSVYLAQMAISGFMILLPLFILLCVLSQLH
jgi:predicted membrane channel-forming protein YqfA (hemolysin III family)